MPSTRKETASQLRSKQVLAVRALIGRLSWLDGTLYWQDGRVAWHHRDQVLVPEVRDLARTQRALNKIAGYRGAARQVLGDWEGWLAAKRNRLTLAKYLSQVVVVDLHRLVTKGQFRDIEAIDKLASLITAEALCANTMSISPAATTVAIGEAAIDAVSRECEDSRLPLEARMLAALSLGAICRLSGQPGFTTLSAGGATSGESCGSKQALRRAFRWGQQHGLPAEPAMVAYFLQDAAGEKLWAAYRAARVRASHFSRLDKLSRQLAADGLSPKKLVSVVEAIAGTNCLAEILWASKERPSDSSFSKRRWKAEQDQERRQALVEKFVGVITEFARCTKEPEAIRAATTFTQQMLDLGPKVPELTETTCMALEAGISLDAQKAWAYVELLADKHHILWDREDIPAYVPGQERAMFGSWVFRRWVLHGKPLVTLLNSIPDAKVLAEAIDLRIHHFLTRYAWASPAMLEFVLTIYRRADLQDRYGTVLGRLHEISNCFADVPSARAAFKPLFTALSQLGKEQRTDFLPRLLGQACRTHKKVKVHLGVLARALPVIVQMKSGLENWHMIDTMLGSALILHDEVGDQSTLWLSWLANHIAQMDASKRYTQATDDNMQAAVTLAAALADGSLAQFQKLVVAAHKCRLGENQWLFERGMRLLKGLPALQAPISQALFSEPCRCSELIVKLGLITGLGTNALKPLKALDDLQTARTMVGTEWNQLLSAAPHLSGLVTDYCRARDLLGPNSSPPDNVKRAFDEQSKILRELTHLETLLQKEPQRAQLQSRAENLRSYLANEKKMEGHMLQLAKDRLTRATVEAQLQVAEKQTTACFIRQLGDMAGRLPDSLKFDRYLLNAILLTVDIYHNRRLLRHMLRASISGDREWRERQPGNQAFLATLAGRGVDVKMWVAAFPRRYRLPGVARDSVRLFFETDPVRVLEMGNYFDTCLSFGRENAFSTVANACDLNKRVVFAADGKGRIVGRKLIGIEENGALVGFRTYTSLADGESNKALRGIFREYLSEFAARCGLTLADQGTVLPIVAKYWYDDGTVGWQKDVDTTMPPRSQATRRPVAAL